MCEFIAGEILHLQTLMRVTTDVLHEHSYYFVFNNKFNSKKIANFQMYNNFIKSRNNDIIIYYSWLVAVCRELVNGSRKYSIEIKNKKKKLGS